MEVRTTGVPVIGERELRRAADILRRHPEFSADNAETILRDEVGLVYSKILEQCGVFARTDAGHTAFLRFVRQAAGMTEQ